MTSESSNTSAEEPIDRNSDSLTPRQRREREYYDQYSQLIEVEEIDFAPILGEESRPWNSYWFTYGAARQCRVEGEERRALDFGCGDGSVSVMLARLDFHVSGFDISSKNIEICHAQARRYGVEERTHFSVQAAERLDYDDDMFDLVVGFDILHHIEIEHAITECRRVLKPGGTAVFREHIAAPVIDAVRNAPPFTWIAPRDKSFDRHITEDEKKLTGADVRAIRRIFPTMECYRFDCFTRLVTLMHLGPGVCKAMAKRIQIPVERLDNRILRWLPFFQPFAGSIVMVLHKEHQEE